MPKEKESSTHASKTLFAIPQGSILGAILSKIGKNNQLRIGLLLFCMAGALSLSLFPNFKSGQIHWGNSAPKDIHWPFLTSDIPPGPFDLTIEADVGIIHPRFFSVVADDEILSAKVNGIALSERQFPIRLHVLRPEKLDLENTLRPGKNELQFSMKNNDGPSGLRIFVHPLDPLHLLWALCLAGAFAHTLMGVRYYFPSHLTKPAVWILIGGITLRILYVCGTPYFLRAYDLGGHVEYIKYIADNLTIPEPGHGWETHQPPLYYLICGAWMVASGQTAGSWLYGQWQFLSLMLSIASLILAIPIGKLLFPKPIEETNLNGFLVLVACFPGLVFFASRISNDVLFAAISFFWLYFLLRWWERPTFNNWIPISIALGIGFLTKNGALVLTAITLTCLLIRTPQPRKIVQGSAILAAGTLILAGWYQIPRALTATDPSAFVVGKFILLDDGLRIQGSAHNLITFNPAAVVEIPFNHTWIDKYRRQYFPEFFFKSAFFGEWPWGQYLLLPARILVIAGMLLALLTGAGTIYAFRKLPAYCPLILIIGFVLAFQVLYILREPFSCNQDFRYFIILVAPLAAFSSYGAAKLGTAGNSIYVFFNLSCVTTLVCLLYI